MTKPVYKFVRHVGPTGSYLTTEPANAEAKRLESQRGDGGKTTDAVIGDMVKQFLMAWQSGYARKRCPVCLGTGAEVPDIYRQPAIQPCPHCGDSDKPTSLFFMKETLRIMREAKALYVAREEWPGRW